jgi:acetyl esterase/lipase
MNSSTNKNQIIPLWPEGAPGSEDWTQVEAETSLPDGTKVIQNVTQPSLTVYPAVPEKATGTAVIVCPGGAWHFLAIEHEGTQVAEWLAAHGITAFILRYRVIRTGKNVGQETDRHLADQATMETLMRELRPLNQAEGRRAMQVVRQRAGEWGIRSDRIGMMGFSAGAGFTVDAVLNNPPETRPDFAAPIYPAVFQEVVAPADAPPLFLLCANDDDMATAGCQFLYKAWQAVHRPVEMHIYSKGGHGFGMYQQGLPSDTWIERFWEWMKAHGSV